MAHQRTRPRAEWQEQLAKGVRDVREIPGLTEEQYQQLEAIDEEYPFFTTPYYLSLIENWDPSDPIYLQQMPDAREFENPNFLEDDPLDEEDDMPVPHLTHRYPDRVLFVVTHTCAMYCRFCTRKRKVGKNPVPRPEELQRAIDYIAEHEEIRDVLLSGGDPLTLTDSALEWIVSRLRASPHLDLIRVGTKIPCVNPERITPELCRMLAKYHPFYVNTHFNHPRELTPEAVRAGGLLVDHGIPMGCQTVLLRGVNDDPEVMKELMHALLKARNASAVTGLPAIGDDSGLVVPALGGAPGIYSARFAGPDASPAANNAKLVAALAGVADRRAHFYCALVFLERPDDPVPLIATGMWHGEIVDRPRGGHGFGYDPHFFVPELGATAAELAPEIKNARSHRGIAAGALARQLAEAAGP